MFIYFPPPAKYHFIYSPSPLPNTLVYILHRHCQISCFHIYPSSVYINHHRCQISVYIFSNHHCQISVYIFSITTVKYPFIYSPSPLSNICNIYSPCIYSKSPLSNTPSYILNHHGQIPLHIFCQICIYSPTAVKYPSIYSPSPLSNICLYILHHRCQISVYIFSITAVKYLFIYSP